jgi:hypothetical protein
MIREKIVEIKHDKRWININYERGTIYTIDPTYSYVKNNQDHKYPRKFQCFFLNFSENYGNEPHPAEIKIFPSIPRCGKIILVFDLMNTNVYYLNITLFEYDCCQFHKSKNMREKW